jgi:hypothetical protein
VKTPPASPKAVYVGHRDRLLLVLYRHDRGDRPKYLLVKGGHSLAYVSQHCRWIVSAAAVRNCPPEQTARAVGDAAFDLPMHRVAQIVTS